MGVGYGDELMRIDEVAKGKPHSRGLKDARGYAWMAQDVDRHGPPRDSAMPCCSDNIVIVDILEH
jgi:hypothetical protein